MCVQSMDGMLSFFEQESFAFGRFLPGFLLPGPLSYIAKTDSFITASSSRLVESYKYVALSQNFHTPACSLLVQGCACVDLFTAAVLAFLHNKMYLYNANVQSCS